MDEFAKNITGLCSTLQPYGYVAAIVSAAVIGIMLAVPSEKAHEKAKKIAPWVAIGLILFMSATSLGNWFADQITFSAATKK